MGRIGNLNSGNDPHIGTPSRILQLDATAAAQLGEVPAPVNTILDTRSEILPTQIMPRLKVTRSMSPRMSWINQAMSMLTSTKQKMSTMQRSPQSRATMRHTRIPQKSVWLSMREKPSQNQQWNTMKKQSRSEK